MELEIWNRSGFCENKHLKGNLIPNYSEYHPVTCVAGIASANPLARGTSPSLVALATTWEYCHDKYSLRHHL